MSGISVERGSEEARIDAVVGLATLIRPAQEEISRGGEDASPQAMAKIAAR